MSKFFFMSKKFFVVKVIKFIDIWKKEMVILLDYLISLGVLISGKLYREFNKYGILEWMRYFSEEFELENILMIVVGDEDDGIIFVFLKF